MSAELVAVLGAIAALFTAIGAYVKVTYGKPKAIADGEAQRLANSLAPVTHLQSVIATMQQQINHLNAEVLLLRDSNRDTQQQLDTTLDRLGILSRENRDWADFHAVDMTNHLHRLGELLTAAGVTDVPEPPEPPHPRTRFTRRSDFPTRDEFDAHHARNQRRTDDNPAP